MARGLSEGQTAPQELPRDYSRIGESGHEKTVHHVDSTPNSAPRAARIAGLRGECWVGPQLVGESCEHAGAGHGSIGSGAARRARAGPWGRGRARLARALGPAV